MSRNNKHDKPESLPDIREVCFYDDEDPKKFNIGYYVNYDFIKKSLAEVQAITSAIQKDPIYMAALFKGMIDEKLIAKLRELALADWHRGTSKGSYYKEKMQELQAYKAISEQQCADIEKLKEDKKKLIAKVDAPMQAESDIQAITDYLKEYAHSVRRPTKDDLILRIAMRIGLGDKEMDDLHDALISDNN